LLAGFSSLISGVEVLKRQGSNQPHYVEGAVLLANGEALVFLDKLKHADRELGVDELNRLTRLALSIKEVSFINQRG
jgi:hypothetical protein